MSTRNRTASLAAVLTLAIAGQAQASLLLDASVTNQFNGHTTTTNTNGNDLPGKPSTLYFGQLKATSDGWVDFFYVGNEAAYTNTFHYGAANTTTSTAGRPDVFSGANLSLGSMQVLANTFLDFGFCTDGGDSVNNAGRCAENDSASSLRRQFNYNQGEGYRSIGFSSLSAYDPNTGGKTFNGNPGTSDIWWAFWDDSGAKNDDNHDDMIIGMRFRPNVTVPEPGALAMFTLGLLGAGFALNRRPAAVRR